MSFRKLTTSWPVAATQAPPSPKPPSNPKNSATSRAGQNNQGQKGALPSIATALRIWQHSHLVPLVKLKEDLQDRILILRNHPDVCAMSHNRNIISYAAHQDYLRELQRRQPLFDCCALYCDAIRLLKESPLTYSPDISGQVKQREVESNFKIEDAANGLKILRPVIGVVSLDMRISDRPLLGLYKNLYHYPHIRLGRALLFASMLRASELGLREVFLECYTQNMAMQKLARQLGFLPQSAAEHARQGSLIRTVGGDERGELLSYQRYLPSSKKLLQDPMFADFAELKRESISLQAAPSAATRLR